MISPFRTAFPNFNYSKNTSSSTYLGNVKFLLLNLLTCGVYGTSTSIEAERMNIYFKDRQFSYLQKKEKNERSVEEIATLLHAQFEEAKLGVKPEETALNTIQLKINALVTNFIPSDSFAPSFVTLVSNLFLNIVTIGMYGLIKTNALNEQNHQLLEEGIQLQNHIDDQVIKSREFFNRQIKLLKDFVLANNEVKSQANDLDEPQLQGQLAIAEEGKEFMEGLLAEPKEILNLKQVIVSQLQEMVEDAQKKENVITKQEDKTQAAKAALKNVSDLSNAIATNILAAATDKVGPDARKLKLVGGEVIDIDVAAQEKIDPQIFSKEYEGLTTAYQVIDASFNHAFDDLVYLSSNKTLPIVLNDSAEIISNENCDRNRLAVYRYMALHLITHSAMIDDHTLQLNEEGVTIFSSCPEQVRTRKDGSTNAVIELNLKYHDQFTPPPGHFLPKGIDPVFAKTIYSQLNEEEKETLLYLLLEPLISDDNPTLQAHLEKLKANTASTQKIRACEGLLSDMGESINKKFGSMLGFSWVDKASNYDESVLPMIKKVEKVAVDDTQENSTVEWKINIDCFEKVDPNFAKMMLENQKHYQNIWRNMSKGLVLNPYDSESQVSKLDAHNFKEELRKQFYVWYRMKDSHWCLLSSFCAITQTDPNEFKGTNITKIHHAMANYLDDPKVAKEFEKSIASEHKITLAKYKAMLRQDKISQYLGLTEIYIYAHMMGVRVILFTPENAAYRGLKLDKYGLQTPESEGYHFGPNTKEKLYITYQESGGNYYYTFPKLKTNILQGEAGESLKRIDKYWSTVDHN